MNWNEGWIIEIKVTLYEKEPLENQAALVYNLIRKVYRMQYPIALSKELFMRISILHFVRGSF